MGEQSEKWEPQPIPLLPRLNPRKWQPPIKQVEDALAGNMDIDAPVSFFSRKKEKGE